MIQGGDVLLTMAQIAIGLAGFSGVVAAFSQTREFPAADRIRFLMLIGGTFFVILLAFVPLLLELGGLQEPGLWRWASGIWLVAFFTGAPLVLVGRRIIVREGRPAPGWSVALVLLVAMAACLAQLGNVMNWPFQSGPLPFLFALIAGLIGSGSIFVYLVLIRPDREDLTANTRERDT
jgi:hypothetical protein